MATAEEWSVGFARQAAADLNTFDLMQGLDVPECHRLQFLQMACEKLVKAHLCGAKTAPESIQASHAYIARNLPKVLKHEAIRVNLGRAQARDLLGTVKLLSQEIEALAPSVKRGGRRPDNCEYPWDDDIGCLRTPLDWTFTPSKLIVERHGRTILKLIRGSIDRLARSRLCGCQ